MPQRLSSFAHRLVDDKEGVRASLTVPLLVWESGGASASPQPWSATEAGGRLAGPRKGEPLVFEVKKSPTESNNLTMGVTVGRTARSDIQLEDSSVSRLHAYFKHDARTGSWMLVDAESSNGTFVGPLKLASGGAAMLQDNVKVVFGSVEARFLLPRGFVAYLEEMSRG